MTKPTKWLCAQRRLRSTWASAQSDESSLCAQWVAKVPSFLHADSKDSAQTGRMPRLIWVFAERTVTLLVLSCRGSYVSGSKPYCNLVYANCLHAFHAQWHACRFWYYHWLCRFHKWPLTRLSPSSEYWQILDLLCVSFRTTSSHFFFDRFAV